MRRGPAPACGYSPTVQSAEVERTVETLKMEVEQIMKGHYKHFMQKAGRGAYYYWKMGPVV